MPSHAQGSAIRPEGTSLPPARPFGDPHTLTLPRRRRHAPQGVVVLAAATEASGETLRAGIMRVEATSGTVTF